MTNEAIEAAARAMSFEENWDGIPFSNFLHAKEFRELARAAAPALMEEGARLALEAAAEAVIGYVHPDYERLPGDPFAVTQVRTLDPAAIVKGAGRE